MNNDPSSNPGGRAPHLFILRRPGLWIALWLALEALAIKLLAGQLGLGLALMILVLKSGFGLLLVIAMTGRAFAGMMRSGFNPARFERIGIGLLIGLMLMMPGVVLSVLVLALIAPGVRAALRRSFTPPASKPDDIVDLEPGEWRDITADPPGVGRRD